MRNHFITTALSALLILPLHTVNARADRGHGGDDDGGAEIRGIIESLPASGLVGDWTVSGRTVHVTASTTIEQEHGQPAVGAPVEVKGDALADGSIDASRIEVEGPGGDDDSGDDNGGGSGDPHGNHTGGGVAKFFGTVESMTADLWTVGGRAVRVTAATVVEREHGVEPSIGAVVKVEGAQLADGSVEARKIEVKTGPAPSGAATGFVQLRAAVDALPLTGLVGEWMVGGRTVHVTAATRVEQKLPVQLGVLVEVRGNQRPDGSIDAGAVEVKKAKGGKGRLAKVFGTIESLPASGLVGE
jgi:hypothetical protein